MIPYGPQVKIVGGEAVSGCCEAGIEYDDGPPSYGPGFCAKCGLQQNRYRYEEPKKESWLVRFMHRFHITSTFHEIDCKKCRDR